jgi:hypothetical protein
MWVETEKSMRHSATMLFALIMTPVIAGCTRHGDIAAAPAAWPDAECHRLGLDFAIEPRIAVDGRLKILRTQMLPAARAGGRTFPGYDEWIGTLTDALRHHAITDGGDASRRAQDEFADYVPPMPTGSHDMYLLAAMREQTRFNLMAKIITEKMRCQTDQVRSDAADYITSDFALAH